MFDSITDWFSDMEIEWSHVGWAFLFWACGLIGIWKGMIGDATLIKPYVKIILTIVTLPLCYFILNYMANR